MNFRTSQWGSKTLVLVFAFSLIAAACSPATQTETGAQPEGNGEETEEMDPLASLEARGARWANIAAKIIYEYLSKSEGKETTGTFTLYWKPPGMSRTDIESGGETNAIISTNEMAYSCSFKEETCFQFPSSGSIPPLVPFANFFDRPEGLSDQIAAAAVGLDVQHSTMEIAGQSTECYGVSAGAQGATGMTRWCFTEEGILAQTLAAFGSGESSGSFELTATSIELEVDDSVFEPPFPVQEIPDFGQVPGAGPGG